jgi:transketolase
LFSAVSEALIGTYPVPVVGIGLNDFAESGDYEQLLTKYGFSAQNIVSKVREII